MHLFVRGFRISPSLHFLTGLTTTGCCITFCLLFTIGCITPSFISRLCTCPPILIHIFDIGFLILPGGQSITINCTENNIILYSS